MKKYLRLICNICKRSTDKPVDLTHFTPDSCTITFGCLGRLQPIEYRSNANIISTPEVGITDWVARGTSATTSASTTQVLLSTSTGARSQFVVAARIPSLDALAGDDLVTALSKKTLTLSLEIRNDAPKDYRQYVFRRDVSFSTVSGTESGLEKKTLRFKAYGVNPDMVEVFVNGVKLEMGTGATEYQLYDGTETSGVAPNTVLLNTPVQQAGVTQVDVIVSKQVMATTRQMTLTGNYQPEERSSVVGAWENISTVERLVSGTWTKFYLFTADDSVIQGAINLNSVMTIASGEVVTDDGVISSNPIALGSMMILLARPPYTQVDRSLNLFVPVSTLSIERDYLKYSVVDGVNTLQVAETAVSASFPVLRATKINQQKILRTTSVGEESQLSIDGNVAVGPDN